MQTNTFPYKYVLFDWDNTLVDSLPLIRKAHDYVRTQLLGSPFTDDDFAAFCHFSARDAYTDLYGKGRLEEGFQHLDDFMHTHHLKELYPYKGTLDFLKLLKNQNIRMGVVSNKRQHFLDAEIKHLEYTPFFDCIIGAGTAEKDKPDAAPILMALESLGIEDINEAIYFGDSETDILTSKNANISMTYINKDLGLLNKYKSQNIIISNFSDINSAYNAIKNNF